MHKCYNGLKIFSENMKIKELNGLIFLVQRNIVLRHRNNSILLRINPVSIITEYLAALTWSNHTRINLRQKWTIDHMHMTSQKGAQLRWGSNETLPRASSPSMQPGGQTLQATPPGWPARTRALRGWVPMRTASTTRARCATLDWRRCYGDVTLCDVNA